MSFEGTGAPSAGGSALFSRNSEAKLCDERERERQKKMSVVRGTASGRAGMESDVPWWVEGAWSDLVPLGQELLLGVLGLVREPAH